MKKNVLKVGAIVLSLAIAISTTFLAQKQNVLADGIEEDDITAALENQPSGSVVEIELTEDIDLINPIHVGEGVKFRINLNGYTLRAPSDESAIVLDNLAQLTIDGGNVYDISDASGTRYINTIYGNSSQPLITGRNVSIVLNGPKLSGGTPAIDYSGSFTMVNGLITECRNGAVVMHGNGTQFAMMGGSFTGNLNYRVMSDSQTEYRSAIVMEDPGTINISAGSFTNNFSNQGGGAIHADAGNVVVSASGARVNFIGNKDYGAIGGGAIYIGPNATLTASGNVWFFNNEAQQDGGVIYSLGNCQLYGCDFGSNSTNQSINGNGGAVCLAGTEKTYEVEKCVFKSNKALSGEGGGIYLENGTLQMTDTSLTMNEALGKSGGIYVGSDFSVHGDVQIHDNKGEVEQSRAVTHNVYLPLVSSESGVGRVISVEEASSGLIGVTTENEPEENLPVVVTSGIGNNNLVITSDENYDLTSVSGEVAFTVKSETIDFRFDHVVIQSTIGLVGILSVDEADQVDSTYVEFTIGNRKSKVYFNDFDKTDKAGVYAVTCNLYIPELSQDVTALYHRGGSGISTTFTESRRFGNYISGYSSPDSDYKSFIEALLVYGSYAQQYFRFNANNLPARKDQMGSISGVTIEGNFGEKTVTKVESSDDTNISYYASSLLLWSNTAMRQYFKVEDKDTIDSYDVYFGEGESKTLLTKHLIEGSPRYFYVEVTGIGPKEMADQYLFTVKKGTESIMTVKYSAMNYFQKMASQESSSEALKNLCKAAYKYYDEATKLPASN